MSHVFGALPALSLPPIVIEGLDGEPGPRVRAWPERITLRQDSWQIQLSLRRAE